jgi:short-subunit dehydrogenase
MDIAGRCEKQNMTRRVALITGASSGIGAELAKIFAGNGHHVVLVARHGDALNALATEIADAGDAAPLVISCDLTREDAGEVLVAALLAADVEVEYVVNNAGFGLFGAAAELDRGQQLGMLDLNVRALTELALRFAPDLMRHRGGLLNVASVAGFLPGPHMAVYYASKAYVLSFSQALYQEWKSRGVRVTTLCPGHVPTGFQARAGYTPRGASLLAMTPAEVARAGYEGLMAGKRLVIPGAANRLAMFMLRFAPRALALRSVEMIQRRD